MDRMANGEDGFNLPAEAKGRLLIEVLDYFMTLNCFESYG